jgi:sterol 14-demethylase
LTGRSIVARVPPALPGGLPWLGHALDLRRDPVGLLRRGQAELGDIFSLRLAGTPVTALIGPPAHGAFFSAPEDQLSAREVYHFTVPVFGRGVVYDASPAVMDEQMGLLFPALRDDRLHAYARVMEEEAEAYVASWGEAGEVDLLVALNELTVFIASRCLVGVEFRRRLSRELAALFHDLERGINLIALANPYLPLPAFRRRDRARARMAALILGIIAERRAGAAGGEDFLEVLMAAVATKDEQIDQLVDRTFAREARTVALRLRDRGRRLVRQRSIAGRSQSRR